MCSLIYVDWFHSEPVKINLFHWAAVRKQDYGPDRQRNSCFFFFKKSVTSCYILYFLNGKSPHVRACHGFCGISKLCLGMSYLNSSVVLSSFKIMILRRYFAVFLSVKGTQLWKSCAVKADKIIGSLPVDLCCLPFQLTALEILTVLVAHWFTEYPPLCLLRYFLLTGEALGTWNILLPWLEQLRHICWVEVNTGNKNT